MTTPLTVGDPEAMRALASELSARADLLRAGQRLPSTKLAAATFEGPAAHRLNGTAAELASRVGAVCDDLLEIASSLRAEATTVEVENAELRREAEKQDDAPIAPPTSAAAEPQAAQ